MKKNKRTRTLEEHNKLVEKQLKKAGIDKGEILLQHIPKHIAHNMVCHGDADIRSWTYSYNKKRHLAISFPLNTNQRDAILHLRKALKFHKIFNIKLGHGSKGAALLEEDRLPFGTKTGIKRFVIRRNKWIRDRFLILKKRNISKKKIFQKIKDELSHKKPYKNLWKPRREVGWKTSLINKEYDLKISTIRNICYRK